MVTEVRWIKRDGKPFVAVESVFEMVGKQAQHFADIGGRYEVAAHALLHFAEQLAQATREEK